ncbi:MAG: hypothetical protein LBC99_03745 [Spirochaetota bacterium]|jgi:3-deoxy-D-manno-octulosonic-acid transferase|nr:hypothetical protein [Spirochaetota bacterium]
MTMKSSAWAGMILFAYDCALYLLLPFYILAGACIGIWNPAGFQRWFARLGWGWALRELPKEALWLHAVSVGEVAMSAILLPYIRAEHGNRAIILSCTTASGFAMAKKKFGADFPVFFAPLDTACVIRRFFCVLKPKALAVAEMELWPNLFKYAGIYSVPLIIYNARMPDADWRRYARFKTLFARVLLPVRLIAAQSAEDASRYCDIGAAIDRIQLVGNIKCDLDLPPAKSAFRFADAAPVIVLASSHPGEEALVLDVFALLAAASVRARLVIAPRNIARAKRVARMAARRGLRAVLRSRSRGREPFDADVLVLDSIGELIAAYSAARLVIIGGSFTKRVGGHNPLEAAAAARPIIFGPYMANFRESRVALLAGDAAREICNRDDLLSAVRAWLGDPQLAKETGERAHAVLKSLRGAAKRTAFLITNYVYRR